MQPFSKTLLTLLLFATAFGLYAQPAFVNKLPIPPLIDAQDGVIELVIQQKTHKFNPGNPSDSLNGSANQPNGITTFSYNKNQPGADTLTVLGPTLYWRQYQPVHIRVTNKLPAANASGTDSTTTHWHGVELPAQFDGGPHQPILRDSTWDIMFNVVDYGSTMWYHPHFHNRTLEQVQMGLSGMIIVEESGDILQPLLPHTYGVDDIPVILGDIGLQKQNNDYALTLKMGKRPFNIVNGVNSPYVKVPRHFVRLRILNGSTRKGVKFGFSTSYHDPASSLIPFKLIATDGGYTTEAVTMTDILNGPGAREEVVLDLSSYPIGDTVYLSNLNQSIPNYVVGSPLPAPNGGTDPTRGTAFLAMVITDDSAFPGYQPITSFPSYSVAWEPDLGDTINNIVGCRHKNLVGAPGMGFTIDGSTFDMEVINDTICVNTKEIWEIENKSPIAHPFHIHKIQFRILSITDATGANLNLMERGLNGPKDDILILPGWKVRFMGNFSDYPNPIEAKYGYMYHCHILTHEDHEGGGMMHQFVVANRPECEAGSPPVVCQTVSTDQPSRQIMVLYPNPASGEFFVRGNSAAASQLRILDLQGRVLSTQTLPPFTGEQRVTAAGLPPGLYLAEWHTREGVVVGKVVLR